MGNVRLAVVFLAAVGAHGRIVAYPGSKGRFTPKRRFLCRRRGVSALERHVRAMASPFLISPHFCEGNWTSMWVGCIVKERGSANTILAPGAGRGPPRHGI